MQEDFDIKIAGEKPSGDIIKNKNNEYPSNSEEFQFDRTNGNIDKAKKLGAEIAEVFCSTCKKEIETVDDPESITSLFTQRIILLSFTATVAFEKFCPSLSTANTAQNVFFEHIQKIDENIYKNSSDSGAFSFYFLAYKSYNDVERRIGQTFAMICGHDGDPIYQELGEALYCWFLGVVKDHAENYNFITR